jgi:predicted O-methyltransferase YrrM
MNKIDKFIYDNISLMPEDLQGWNGNSKVFTKLIDAKIPKLIIEVGTWKGQSAITMAEHIKKKLYDTRIICVDTWLGALEFWDNLKHTPERNLYLRNGYPQIYYQFLSNVIHRKVQEIIMPFPNTSTIAYKYFKNNRIVPDMVYIDASHDELDVYNDLKNYYEILAKGGIIFGDDFDSWKGVRDAVNKFCKENYINFTIEENNFWIIKK